MDTDNRELYRIISGFPKYCISNRGRVMNILSGKYLSTSRNKHGYLLVDLYNGTSHKIFYVHRLVASYFIPNPENLCCVDHIDSDKTNNFVDNLRWVTYSENQNNPISLRNRIENCSLSKKVEQYDLKGNKVAEYISAAEAGRILGCKVDTYQEFVQAKESLIKVLFGNIRYDKNRLYISNSRRYSKESV